MGCRRQTREYFAEVCSDLPSCSWPGERSFLLEVFPARYLEGMPLPSTVVWIPVRTEEHPIIVT